MENQTLRTHRDSTMVDHMTNGVDEEALDSETELFQIRQIRPQIRPSSMIEMRDPNRHLMQTVRDHFCLVVIDCRPCVILVNMWVDVMMQKV